MCTQVQLTQIIHRLMREANQLCQGRLTEAILFGSYARHESEDDSDVDVMLLIDMPREELVRDRHDVAHMARDVLCEYGVVVSPILESDEIFERNKEIYPFFINVNREGVRYVA